MLFNSAVNNTNITVNICNNGTYDLTKNDMMIKGKNNPNTGINVWIINVLINIFCNRNVFFRNINLLFRNLQMVKNKNNPIKL